MNNSALPIISIVQSRVEAFLAEIFDICQSSEDTQPAKTLWGTIATELAIYDAVEVVIRRRRNKRSLFAHIPTDIVHSIFGIVLDLDRVHDHCLPLNQLDDNRRQIFRMRQVSSVWNHFLLSSPQYWRAINIASPPQVITAGIQRSGSTPLCIYCYSKRSWGMSIHLPEELRSCTRVQTLRSEDPNAYRPCRSLLRDPAPALQTLQLTRPPKPIEDNAEPLGDLPSICHLTAVSWKPPSDTAGLVGLKELVLYYPSDSNMELLRVLSACPNLEGLTVIDPDNEGIAELPVISPITFPRLQRMRLEFKSNESAIKLIRGLYNPQCLRRTLFVRTTRHLERYIADYRRFMSLEESWTKYPKSARIHSNTYHSGMHLAYETDSHQIRFEEIFREEWSTVHELVQELQRLFKGPSLTMTVEYSEDSWPLLRSLSDQNVRTIVARFKHSYTKVENLLKIIGAGSTDIPDGTMSNDATNWPFKSLESIEIHAASVDLDDFPRLVEGYLHKSSKPLLEEIVLVGCSLRGQELSQAAERTAAIGITIREVRRGRY